MSYILDALRKSEESRRRQRGPDLTLAEAPAATARRSVPLHALLALALLVNAAVLGAWFWRSQVGATSGPVAEPAVTVATARTPLVEPPLPAAATADPAWRQQPAQPVSALPGRLRDRLPALSISTHIYADDPAFREVSINGRSYREGDAVEGLELLRITAGGVHLGFEGRVIELDLRDEWDY